MRDWFIKVKNALRQVAAFIYRAMVQTKVFITLRNFVFKHRYDSIHRHYPQILEEARKKVKGRSQISVAFYLWETSKWKAESLYRLFEGDNRFDPYIVIVPFAGGLTRGQDYIKKMKDMYDYFTKSNHKVILPYSEDMGKVLDRDSCPEIKADIIFQMNCWHEYGPFTQFSYRQNLDTLQCYIPYAWMISNRHWEHFNRDFHNVMWKIFYETPFHVDMAKKYAITKGRNAVATGYPLLDVFFDKNYHAKDVWKIKDPRIKRIIWAPHAYIKEENRCSNFLYVCDYMLDLAKKYHDRIQIAFKPHPELKKKLDFGILGWNEKRRIKYYRQWEEMSNTMLCEGEYIDLFLTSDAIINDCGSFTAEYLCTYKPMLFLQANERVIAGWNECGKEIAKNIYLSKQGEKIEWFIESVVIKGNDYMKKQREEFVDTNLKPQNKYGASMAIYDYLKRELGLLD